MLNKRQLEAQKRKAEKKCFDEKRFPILLLPVMESRWIGYLPDQEVMVLQAWDLMN